MADHAAVHAVHDPNIGNTGLDNRKVGMWAFLGSDCMFFGSLIGTYLAYKGKSISGPLPHEVFDIPLTSYSAALLLASAFAARARKPCRVPASIPASFSWRAAREVGAKPSTR